MYYEENTRLTHPDIIGAETFGVDDIGKNRKVGSCLNCEAAVYETSDTTESCDGLFCDMDCCREYYEIRRYM